MGVTSISCFYRTGLLFSVIGLFLSFPMQAENNWVLIRDSNGIQVFNRDVEGSEIKELKTTSVLEASLDVVFEVMFDVPAGTQWMSNCIESKILTDVQVFTVTENGYYAKKILYTAIGAPFPVLNRECIIETEMTGDVKNRSIIINFHAVPDSTLPVRKGYIRLTDLSGSWSFLAIDDTHTGVVYQSKQNPGGSLPSFLINYVNKDVPYKTIIGLRKIVSEEKYQNAGQRKKVE